MHCNQITQNTQRFCPLRPREMRYDYRRNHLRPNGLCQVFCVAGISEGVRKKHAKIPKTPPSWVVSVFIAGACRKTLADQRPAPQKLCVRSNAVPSERPFRLQLI